MPARCRSGPLAQKPLDNGAVPLVNEHRPVVRLQIAYGARGGPQGPRAQEAPVKRDEGAVGSQEVEGVLRAFESGKAGAAQRGARGKQPDKAVRDAQRDDEA